MSNRAGEYVLTSLTVIYIEPLVIFTCYEKQDTQSNLRLKYLRKNDDVTEIEISVLIKFRSKGYQT